MIKISEQVKEFVREAIKLEIRGREFFNQAADMTHNPLGKKMFQRLAEEEVKHLNAFSKLFSTVIHSDEWKQFADVGKVAGNSEVIEDLVARMRRAEDKSEIEAMRIGMELELKAIDFFKKCAEKGDDPAARNIFITISDEERFHYDLLQAQVDSVTGTGFWLDSREFKMDGKY